MKKTEFLETIYKESGFLPTAKRRKVMAHFSSMLQSFSADAEIDSLAAPGDELRKYLNSTTTHSGLPKPLFIAALILLSPFIVTVSLMVFIMVMALSIIAVMLLTVIPILGIALWFDGVNIILSSIPMHIIFADKLWQIAIGFMQFGAGIVILLLVC